MRTAILSVFFAVISTAAPQQDPSKPISGQPQSQQKPSDPPLSVLCAPGTTIQLGVAYNSAVIASGGTGAYRFAITGGALPAGIALNPATGTISGTPTADGTFSYTVQVTDSAGRDCRHGQHPLHAATPGCASPRGRPSCQSRCQTSGPSRPGNQAAGDRTAGDRPRKTGFAAG